MKRFWPAIAAALLGASCSPVNGAQVHELTTDHYSITLKGDWEAEQITDPEVRNFYSKTRDTGLVMSAIPLDSPRNDTDVIANKMVQFRLAGEEEAASHFNVKMTIVEPVVVKRPWGHAIAYYGSDSKGRHFSYAGAVIPKAVISIYVESPTASEQELKVTLDELLSSLKFDKAVIHVPADQSPS